MVPAIPSRRPLAFALLASLAAGCGGGGGGATGAATEVAFGVTWEQPAPAEARLALSALRSASAGFDTPIPAAVGTIRFTFRDGDSAPCCIAVARGSETFENRSLLLADVDPGRGTLQVAAFPGDFAPAGGVTATCATRPAGQGQPCDATRDALPSYASDEIGFDILPSQRNRVDIEVHSTPFLLDLDPEDGGQAAGPRGPATFTVVDAAHGIDDVDVEVEVGDIDFPAQAVESDDCSDFAADGLPACSQGRALAVRGRRVVAETTADLPAGAAVLRIEATNDASPARSMVSVTGLTVPPATTSTTTSTTTTSTSTSTTTTLAPPTTTTSSSTTTTTTTSTTTTSTTTSTTTTTTTSTTTTTLEPFVTHCFVFRVPETLQLLGISFEVDYSALEGDFVESPGGVHCYAQPFGAIESYDDDEGSKALRAAVALAEPFDTPADVVLCEFAAPASTTPDASQFVVNVTEATGPDLAPADATVVAASSMCPI